MLIEFGPIYANLKSEILKVDLRKIDNVGVKVEDRKLCYININCQQAAMAKITSDEAGFTRGITTGDQK